MKQLIDGITGHAVCRATIRGELSRISQVAAWLDLNRMALHRKLSRLAQSDSSILTDPEFAAAARTSVYEAKRVKERAETGDRFPSVASGLDDGNVTANHLDAITDATKILSDEQRNAISQHDVRLARIASQVGPAEFARIVRQYVHDVLSESDAVQLLQQQRAAIRLKHWIDQSTGMWHIHGIFDPESGAFLEAKIAAETEVYFRAGTTVAGAPTDTSERQAFLRACALVTTLCPPVTMDVPDSATAQIKEALAAEFEGRGKEISEAVRSLTKKLVRKRVVDDGERIDGRGPKDLRPVTAEVGVLPTVHGSGLFQRGETQVLNVITLGMPKMNQLLDTLSPESHKRYMHHYNMPPSANGETGRVGSPKRREIGHGALAERALIPVIPPTDEFNYVLRLVSEVLASNGSTSMASVCASSLSLMDAGVPIKAPVAGIAMGLIYAEGKYTTLTDILGAEDAFGDMDFKVAGTRDFVTALQLDTKIEGIPADVLAAALAQARDARLAILDIMDAAISAPREEVAETAPKIISFEIPIDKIGEVIGPKGKVINAIQADSGADISIDDDGMVGIVSIGSKDASKVAEAKRMVLTILDPPKAEIGAVYSGRVVSITKFGAFVNILPGRDGLVHISKLGRGKRVEKVEDVLTLGQSIDVKVEDIDPNGKVSLTLAGDTPEAPASSGAALSGTASSGAAMSSGHGSSSASSDATASAPAANREFVSFQDNFDAEISGSYGDLGPEGAPLATDDGGRGRGGDRGGRPGGNRSSGDRNRRR